LAGAKLTVEQRATVKKVARKMARKVMKKSGLNSKDAVAFKEYWGKNKDHYVMMSWVAHKELLK